jgi:hypothetical protein
MGNAVGEIFFYGFGEQFVGTIGIRVFYPKEQSSVFHRSSSAV